MKTALTLTEKETFFLKESRQDPITGDEFNLGDEIVFCASCKSAFLKGSWEYLGYRHCEQEETLEKIPIQNQLQLKAKRIVSLFTMNKQIFTTRILYFVVGIVAIFFNIFITASEQTKSLFLISFGILAFVIFVLITVLPTISIDVYSYHLTFKKFLGLSLKIPYNEIKEVTIIYVRNPLKHKVNKYDYPAFNYFSVRHTNGLTSKVAINLNEILTDANERKAFITFITTLSKQTKVELQLASYFKLYFDENTPLKIKWI